MNVMFFSSHEHKKKSLNAVKVFYLDCVLDLDIRAAHVGSEELCERGGQNDAVEGEAHGLLVRVLLVLGAAVADGVVAQAAGVSTHL